MRQFRKSYETFGRRVYCTIVTMSIIGYLHNTLFKNQLIWRLNRPPHSTMIQQNAVAVISGSQRRDCIRVWPARTADGAGRARVWTHRGNDEAVLDHREDHRWYAASSSHVFFTTHCSQLKRSIFSSYTQRFSNILEQYDYRHMGAFSSSRYRPFFPNPICTHFKTVKKRKKKNI